MTVIAIAGMPGSGKSEVMKQYKAQGFELFDDFNIDWPGNLRRAKQFIAQGVSIAVSDIEFCKADMRQRFEMDIGAVVQWDYFKNDAFKCGCNVLYRKFILGEDRPWRREMELISGYHKIYNPPADARPISVEHVKNAL